MAKTNCLGIIVFVTIISTIFSTGSAFQYKVGDADGWRLPDDNNQEMYETWASNINFHVKDSLLFVYKNDSVIKVSKPGYYHCNESAIGVAPKDGSTLFTLDKPGFYYFVSGNLDHCMRGQRLTIEVPDPASGPSSHSKTNMAASLSVLGLGMQWMHLLVLLLIWK
ncbi:mavicyanin-like protein [Carex littledalei]|uniref:Mavicyanin-like protein n=1 Tax=Carex littledalei TaxID=544730 RepID=A0A833VXI0_9POAL|nr:mavicyanin-like protein [Carex littledalei]